MGDFSRKGIGVILQIGKRISLGDGSECYTRRELLRILGSLTKAEMLMGHLNFISGSS